MIYFPDFELYENEATGEVFWSGKIDEMGEIKITYPATYPVQKFIIEALDPENAAILIFVISNEPKQIALRADSQSDRIPQKEREASTQK